MLTEETRNDVLLILRNVQIEVRAAKDQRNEFGGFQYRNVEKMITEIKPILNKFDSCVTFNDEVIEKAGRWYVKATATLITPFGDVSCSAYAREQEAKKGMDQAQITGACSTYARKYALCGLLAVGDGSTDPDAKQNIDMITPKQIKTLVALAESKGSEIADICKYFKINSLNEMSEEEYGKCLNMLNQKG